ncbi:MAG: DUF805 domain-containing protein [Schwartzia sp.]|nr:DUF805 domain-containing protein [Schwartzia sp. (in: firmicutes)]
MICDKCGADVPEGMKFCGQCGTKIEDNSNNQPVQEISSMQEVVSPQIGIGIQPSSVAPMDNIVAKHEEATKASLFSVVGLFSTYGRRRRLVFFLLAVITIDMYIGLEAVISNDLSMKAILLFTVLPFWVGTASIFKRLHDLDKPNYMGILFAIIEIIYLVVNFYVSFVNPMIIFEYSLLLLIYGISSLLILLIGAYLLFAPGTQGANRYGRSPEELKQDS